MYKQATEIWIKCVLGGGGEERPLSERATISQRHREGKAWSLHGKDKVVLPET